MLHHRLAECSELFAVFIFRILLSIAMSCLCKLSCSCQLGIKNDDDDNNLCFTAIIQVILC